MRRWVLARSPEGFPLAEGLLKDGPELGSLS